MTDGTNQANGGRRLGRGTPQVREINNAMTQTTARIVALGTSTGGTAKSWVNGAFGTKN